MPVMATGLLVDSTHDMQMFMSMMRNVVCWCLLMVAGVASGQSTTPDVARIICGARPLLSQGIDVPVRGVYKPDRHQHLRRTIARLLHGEAMQTVMLGDSIVGDTFGPQYAASGWHRGTAWGVEPLAALYRTDIYSVVSVLGSTGAWYYRQPGNVQTYVLDHLPDVVFIGGISNRDDIEAIRDVVMQIRMERPETEIVLMSGAVNLQRIPDASSLLLNEAAESYEARLARLADEIGAAFINMRGSYDEFIIEATRQRSDIDQGYFQRDPIHANDYGRAVLREIITMFFRPAVECQDRAPVRQRHAQPQLLTLTESGAGVTTVPGVGGISPPPPQTPSTLDVTVAKVDIDLDHSGALDRMELLSSAQGDTDRLKISIDPAVSATNAVIVLPLNLLGGSTLLAADLDHDGLRDLVIGTQTDIRYLYVYFNTGVTDAPFFNPVLLDKGGGAGCTVGLAAFDISADGVSDLFAANGCTVDAGTVDYYQLGTASLDPARLLPESYQTTMSIGSIATAGASAHHAAPSLIIVGTRSNQAATMELGVAAQPSAAAPAESAATGGGSIHWLELMLGIFAAVLRYARRSVFDRVCCRANAAQPT